MNNSKQKIAIYVEQSNPRVCYLFEHLLEETFGFELVFFTNTDDFKQTDFPKISYSKEIICDEIHFETSYFFEETSLKKLRNYFDDESFYQNKLALCFALLTRMEEYFPYNKDKYGRFSYKESIVFKNIDVKKCHVDRFAFELLEKLKEKYPELENRRCFVEQPTIDLDHPFLIKYKTPKRTLFSLLHSIRFLKFNEFFRKILILLSLRKDDYDVYNEIEGFKCFVPLGKFSEIDSFHQLRNKKYIKFLRNFFKNREVCFHPSYQSFLDKKELKREKSEFKRIFGKEPKSSRQHFLAFKLPNTYRKLLANGIKNDYSMGFADQSGFRAGTCTSFYWYDLCINRKTELKIVPFCWMDITLNNYMRLSNDMVKEEVLVLKKECESYLGLYLYIVHNESYKKFKHLYKIK
ncbi:MAG: hypothetical protein H6604_04265 [Flavobacteriales bacterium]|nr:hypothetical protein [Flavobacteriales bacterium]